MTQNSYYVVFMPSETGLYKYFEKKGFNHTMIFYPVDKNDLEECSIVSVISHNKSFVTAGMMKKSILMRYIRCGFYIKVDSECVENKSYLWWMYTPNTCVTITKQILGIRKPFILTPYQLYKYLIKRG